MTNKITTILVTGGSGQLGQSIRKVAQYYPNYKFFFPTREELDLAFPTNIREYFDNQTFDLVINCAAYTDVDTAELEPDITNQLNHLAVLQLADTVKRAKGKLIHISTDYVFSGMNYKPYVEDDAVGPQGVYGLTKLKGEQAIESIMPKDAIIIRTSWIYSEYGNNFVKTMLKLGEQRDELKVIFDQVGTPTYAKDLALAIMSIVQSNEFRQANIPTNIVHYSNEGLCSWYDFAKTIFNLTSIQCQVNSIETKDYSLIAKRPHYSVLNKSKIKQAYSIIIPYWEDSLKHCLIELQRNVL